MQGYQLRIQGRVQGVGFRPYVWRLAKQCALVGEVYNDSNGVVVLAWGIEEQLSQFLVRLSDELPPLAQITELICEPIDSAIPTPQHFTISASQSTLGQVNITADVATCSACLAEVFDPDSRYYRYPFTSCSYCGPRLSVVVGVPYDRVNTTMVDFPLCDVCQSEYRDPENRRFHAQSIACPQCGPALQLLDEQGGQINCEDEIRHGAALIKQGKIIAIKGIGGFHLACDAGNEQAVAMLRQRKRRPRKPFALLVADLAMAGRHVALNHRAEAALQAHEAPLLLLPINGEPLAPSVAPGLEQLALMLPNTPLHHLLMAELDRPIVLTSANVSGEPQVIDNQQALQQLSGIADGFLLHDRAIAHRLDDSLLQSNGDQLQLMRRARGYAPQPISLPPGFEETPAILAMGAELKSSFCLLQPQQALLSPHLGDLYHTGALYAYRQALEAYQQLFDIEPEGVAVDLHSGYHSSQLGVQLAQENNLPVVAVQHHHAHIAAVMVEHGIPRDSRPILGIALDGLGMGEQGELWGGELLLVDYLTCQRLGGLPPIAMPGGDKASKEPWRNLFAHLHATLGWENFPVEIYVPGLVALQDKPLSMLNQMIEKGINVPTASSCGRLFDAMAYLLGLCGDQLSYEGEGAIALQQAAQRAINEGEREAYPIAWHDQGVMQLDLKVLWQAVLADLKVGVASDVIAARFHRGLAYALGAGAWELCFQYGVGIVALSGGVLQNGLLSDLLRRDLVSHGLEVLAPSQVPANDGGIALGQATIAAARLMDVAAP